MKLPYTYRLLRVRAKLYSYELKIDDVYLKDVYKIGLHFYHFDLLETNIARIKSLNFDIMHKIEIVRNLRLHQ